MRNVSALSCSLSQSCFVKDRGKLLDVIRPVKDKSE